MPTITTEAHVTYLLRHGDDCLILAQRLGEWSARAPELETDIALTNLALDLLGQSRALLSHAGRTEGAGRTEDDLAFHRQERQFSNLLLVEQTNGDFAHTMARQLFFDAYQLSLWEALSGSSDETLAGIAAKALKEARYHFRHSETWVVRLGDGTSESQRRMQAGIDDLWRFTGELFWSDHVETELIETGIAADPGSFRGPWDARIDATLKTATLERPGDPFQRVGGREGMHTEQLGHLIAEMQYLPRAYPGLDW